MLSPSSVGRAEKLGYKNVKAFHDGLPAWKKAGNLVYTNAPYVRNNIEKDVPQVVVDLRPINEAKKERIKGAVSIQIDENAKAKFPADKKAPVILYAADTKAAEGAFKLVRGWGYANASVLSGGMEACKKAECPTVSGDPVTTITYVPKPKPGTISVEEFKKLAEKLPVDKVLIDVRNADETAEGMIQGAVNIPASDIVAKMKEIPNNKDIVLYCSTGTRSEISYGLLKDAGYKARFLNAEVEVSKDGKYEITSY